MIQLILLIIGFVSMNAEEKSYQHLVEYTPKISIMTLFLTVINLDMLIMRIPQGMLLNQIDGGIIVGIVELILFLFLGIFFQKSFPDEDLSPLICCCIETCMIFIMLCMFGYEYRWAAFIQVTFNFLKGIYIAVDALESRIISWTSGVLASMHFLLLIGILFTSVFDNILLVVFWVQRKLLNFLHISIR